MESYAVLVFSYRVWDTAIDTPAMLTRATTGTIITTIILAVCITLLVDCFCSNL